MAAAGEPEPFGGHRTDVELSAIFESWHIGDGNYPPLTRGQLVRLSFELSTKHLAMVPDHGVSRFEGIGNAEYHGGGRVLRRYNTDGYSIAVIEAGGFRFYVHGSSAATLTPNSSVEFEGTLLLDHYLWVEFLERYPDPPDLFYNLRVTRIRKVSIPERFVHRTATSVSYPTSVGPSDYGTVEELTTMEGHEFSREFFIIDCDDQGVDGVELPNTFC